MPSEQSMVTATLTHCAKMITQVVLFVPAMLASPEMVYHVQISENNKTQRCCLYCNKDKYYNSFKVSLKFGIDINCYRLYHLFKMRPHYKVMKVITISHRT